MSDKQVGIPPNGLGDKSLEIVYNLYNIQHNQLNDRRAWEFKPLFGLTIGMCIVTYYLLQFELNLHLFVWIITVIAGIFIFGWIPCIHRAHYQDKIWKDYYRSWLEIKIGISNQDLESIHKQAIEKMNESKNKQLIYYCIHDAWSKTQILFVLCVTIFCIFALEFHK